MSPCRHIRPGGWIELYDVIFPSSCDDGTLPEDSALAKWNRLLVEAAGKVGAALGSALEYEGQLTTAGFQNATQVEYKWPTNTWPKDAKYKEIGE